MVPVTLSSPHEKLGISHMRMEEKEGCFLILFHEFEGLSLFVRALALSTAQSLAPGSSYGNGRRSNTWAFLAHKSSYECKLNLGIIQAISQSKECSACLCLCLSMI